MLGIMPPPGGTEADLREVLAIIGLLIGMGLVYGFVMSRVYRRHRAAHVIRIEREAAFRKVA